MPTEKEKMLRGEYYNSRDPEIIVLYHKARRLLKKYNYHLDSEDEKRRSAILKELLGFVGEGVWIEPPFHADYGENVFVGENTFINTGCVFLDDNRITIGRNVLIAPMVQIYTASHPLKASERIIAEQVAGQENQATYLTNSKPVEIGDNVWIGGNTAILPGVKIGEGSTIGACSLVTKDIPPGVLAFGNPCRVVKEL